MLDPCHAALDSRMAERRRKKSDWGIRWMLAQGKFERTRVRAGTRRVEAETSRGTKMSPGPKIWSG